MVLYRNCCTHICIDFLLTPFQIALVVSLVSVNSLIAALIHARFLIIVGHSGGVFRACMPL